MEKSLLSGGPDKCIHSTVCFEGLHEVFDPSKRPWVNIEGADTRRIIDQVRKCPSGALSYFMNQNEEKHQKGITEIEVMARGPLVVDGTVRVKHGDKAEVVKEGKTAFCRCGSSNNKPYCDGTHQRIHFQG
jgi:uncharacterized Fe-S cluster protein YjdI